MGSGWSRHVHFTHKSYLCIVDYDSKIHVIKKTEDLLANSLILACNIIFSECGLPKKIMFDTSHNFMSKKFKKFYKKLNTEHASMSSYHHQSNGQVDE